MLVNLSLAYLLENAEDAKPSGNAQAKGLRIECWLWRAKQNVSTEGFNLLLLTNRRESLRYQGQRGGK